MAIVCYPDNAPRGQHVCCVICQKSIALADATAGCYDQAGNVQFACEHHLMYDVRWLRTWALALFQPVQRASQMSASEIGLA